MTLNNHKKKKNGKWRTITIGQIEQRHRNDNITSDQGTCNSSCPPVLRCAALKMQLVVIDWWRNTEQTVAEPFRNVHSTSGIPVWVTCKSHTLISPVFFFCKVCFNCTFFPSSFYSDWQTNSFPLAETMQNQLVQCWTPFEMVELFTHLDAVMQSML